MFIKKHKNNQYCRTKAGMWVRNPFLPVEAIDINNLTQKKEFNFIINNEISNASRQYARVDAEYFFAPKVVIVSDGYRFNDKKKLLLDLPQDEVVIIAVNKALKNWQINRRIDYYVINNPYSEALRYLPSRYFPPCVASIRTQPSFLQRYTNNNGIVLTYSPTVESYFTAKPSDYPRYFVDDYRNPITAALSLALNWQTEKILLFCCDDSFAERKPGAIKLDNGLYCYEPQVIFHEVVDSIAYWIKNNKMLNINIADCSSGQSYQNIPSFTGDLREFFTVEERA